MDKHEHCVKAIAMYNRYHSPEATARLIECKDDELLGEFEGSFCQTCGAYDYLEDFVYELKNFVDANVKMVDVEQTNVDSYRARYTFRR